MQITINNHVFNARLNNYFSVYTNNERFVAGSLKKFLGSLKESKPNILFSSDDVKLIYRGKQIPRFDFVVQYYGHLGEWKAYVTTYSSLDSLTPGQKKFLTEMFGAQIEALTLENLEGLIKETKDKAISHAKEFLSKQIETAKNDLAEIYKIE